MKALKLLRIGEWERRMGYLGSGVVGQVTEIECSGVVAYVRENFKIGTHGEGGFYITSSQRCGIGGCVLGGKIVPGNAHRYPQILELAAPREHWERIAQLVMLHDSKRRPVVPNRQWTIAKAIRSHWRKAIDMNEYALP